MRHGLEAEDPRETGNSVSPAQFKAPHDVIMLTAIVSQRNLPICQSQISVLFLIKLIGRLRFETYLFLACQESRSLQELVEELKALDC